MAGAVIPFQRSEPSTEMRTFQVTLQPRTRKGLPPLMYEMVRSSAVQALNDAMQKCGLSDPKEDFSHLEMMELTDSNTYRIAFFNTTRQFAASYDASLPVRKTPVVPFQGIIPFNASKPEIAEVVEPLKELLPDTEADEDDYKDAQWYEVHPD